MPGPHKGFSCGVHWKQRSTEWKRERTRCWSVALMMRHPWALYKEKRQYVCGPQADSSNSIQRTACHGYCNYSIACQWSALCIVFRMPLVPFLAWKPSIYPDRALGTFVTKSCKNTRTNLAISLFVCLSDRLSTRSNSRTEDDSVKCVLRPSSERSPWWRQ